ncbi:MAG: Methionine--tRNA ligase [Candidatus Anoxychlamydiales bacterium]|nr:Methionine--tRNA ligase [Candidatus Anoxychlamydiales bacterium]
MKKKILITSALPYANGPIHFGHIAGAYLPADVYARFERLKGRDVLYICGSDEYGVAITLSAELANRTPKEHVDIYHEMIKDFFEKLNFSFDHYSRTTTEIHKKLSQEFFLDLYKNGYIEAKTEKHLFSEKENKFLADRYVIGTCPKCEYEFARGDECPKCSRAFDAKELKNPRSKLTNSKLILKPSKHWYMRFDKFKEKLSSWIKDKDWKDSVLNFSKEYIKDLKERAITRDSTWGVPVPLEEAKGKVLYVWFDAPIGYISATMEWAEKIGDKEKYKDYWFDEKTKLVNFIGKDNIPFHGVFFPAMIMGQKKPYKIVDDLPANEFLMLEKRQFSKSEKWYIDLKSFFEKFTTDQIRFYLASIAPETHDSDFLWKDFQMHCNSELVGKFGNFIHRTLTFIQRFADQKIPKSYALDDVDQKFLDDIIKSITDIDIAYSNYKLRKATQIIMELSQIANVYFDHKKPWKMAKDESKKEELFTCLNLCLKCIKALSLMTSPIIPTSSQKIWKMIGNESGLSQGKWDSVKNLNLEEGKKLPPPEVIFQKIEDEKVIEEMDKLKEALDDQNMPKKAIQDLKNEISYKDFDKIDMRVGKIIEAEKIEKSEKLLKLQVDLGFEKRQIISGIAKSITPDELLNKKVIVVANIKKAKLMGFESDGMILAAGEDDDSLEIPFIQDMEIGSSVC